MFGTIPNHKLLALTRKLHYSLLIELRKETAVSEATGRTRSPNYPSISLGEAIDAIRKVYAKERRGKFPRLALAAHIGYTSINGRSLAKIGAIRAYGLIDGREDALTISSLALAILEAPEGSPDNMSAYRSAFMKPALFSRIHEEYGDQHPSPQTFRWWLTQQHYIGDAADKAMQSYLDSLDLVIAKTGGYVQPVNESEPLTATVTPQNPPRAHAGGSDAPSTRVHTGGANESIAMGVQERVLQSGMLSKQASFRVLVTGTVGLAEIEKLIAKIEMDKDILAEPDITPPMPEGYSDHDSDGYDG